MSDSIYKYIIYKCGKCDAENPIVFCAKTEHKDEYNALKRTIEKPILVSAGQMTIIPEVKELICNGESQSLNVKSREQDTDLVKDYFDRLSLWEAIERTHDEIHSL